MLNYKRFRNLVTCVCVIVATCLSSTTRAAAPISEDTAADRQEEQWVPYVPSRGETHIDILATGDTAKAEVVIIFGCAGYRVDWGGVTRTGNSFYANAMVERWTGPSAQVITTLRNAYDLGPLSPGTYTFSFLSCGQLVETRTFEIPPEEQWVPYIPSADQTAIDIVTTEDTAKAKVAISFECAGYRVDWGGVTRTGNSFYANAMVERWTGPSAQVITTLQHTYDLGPLCPDIYRFYFLSWGQLGKVITFEIPHPRPIACTLYAPWFYESVKDPGDPLSGKLTFVSLTNASAVEATATARITYLSPEPDSIPDEGPFEVLLGRGDAITWTPHSNAGAVETPGIPNATFGVGSVKIDCSQPMVGRVVQVDCHAGRFESASAEQLVEPCRSLNQNGNYEVWAPWFHESAKNPGNPMNGILTFICVRNVSAHDNQLSITYVNPDRDGADEGPHQILLGRCEAITWTPYSDAGGAEMSGIPDASFNAGSVRIECSEPVVGRMIQVDFQNGNIVSSESVSLIEKPVVERVIQIDSRNENINDSENVSLVERPGAQ